LRNQVEERLKFFESGATPEKNIDVMKRVIDSLDDFEDEVILDEASKTGKKRAAEEVDVPAKKQKKSAPEENEEPATKKDKKEKKEKKDKKDKKEKKKEKKDKKEKKNKD
jgi:nucleolar protein 56